MSIGYFGPEGTFTHEALVAAVGADRAGSAAATGGGGPTDTGSTPSEGGSAGTLVPLTTIYDTVIAVHKGVVERALVPIENSLEGSVNATLDTLAFETQEVAIVGELVHPIHQCLIVRAPTGLERIEVVVSHSQPLAQCARFIRTKLPSARVLAAASTAEAVRLVAEHDGPWAALGNRLAAELHGCLVLRTDVQDVEGNETRFVWLARAGSGAGPSAGSGATGDNVSFKTAIVFWGAGSESPGWLVSCLSELSSRGVNLTRIESRPRKLGLGRYMFFVDLEGREGDPRVAAALDALRAHVEVLRVLGSFPAA